MLCFLRLGRGEVLTLLLLRRFVNARISRTWEFFVQRLPTLSAPAALADHGFYHVLNASGFKNAVHSVAEPTRWSAVVVAVRAGRHDGKAEVCDAFLATECAASVAAPHVITTAIV
jgi:hypothetical protein